MELWNTFHKFCVVSVIDRLFEISYNVHMETNLYRVIMVERNRNIQNIVRDYLERDARFALIAFFDCEEEALCFLKNNQADLLLLGLEQSDRFGKKLLEQILKDDINIDTVVMTREKEGGFLKEALHFGATDYLLKPFSQKRFRQSLEGYVSRLKVSEGLKTVDQETADHLLHFAQITTHRAGAKSEREEHIMECFRMASGHEFTVKEIAEKLGFSSVTVRRDLKRLADAGRILSNVDYNTGGHPRIVYRLP